MNRLRLTLLVVTLPTFALAQTSPAPAEPPPAAAAPAPTVMQQVGSVLTKFQLELYGFAELDTMVDSTQSFNDLEGNGNVARPTTLTGQYPRVTFTPRNSRIGLKLKAPDVGELKASGTLEMDFFGYEPAPNSGVNGASESTYFASPTFRIRHAFGKLETPIVDILAGQTWLLFGWQPYFQPNTVLLQGAPGEVYSRTPQLRLTKSIKMDPLTLDIAVAASRPPQRDSGRPDGQAGIRLKLNNWKGWHTLGGCCSQEDSAAIGVSGLYRRFYANLTGPGAQEAWGYGFDVDGFIPIIPGTKEDHANALTLNASYIRGAGINDVFTGLTGGVAFPKVAVAGYVPNIDTGYVTYDKTGAIQVIDWQDYIIGLQYVLPWPQMWISLNYSNMNSDNAWLYGGAGAWHRQEWIAAALWLDATPQVRFGVEYDWTNQEYNAIDGTGNFNAVNHRVCFSVWYLF